MRVCSMDVAANARGRMERRRPRRSSQAVGGLQPLRSAKLS